MTIKDGRLFLESTVDFEDGVIISYDDDGVAVSVSEEKAFDSYNSDVTCTANLSWEQVEEMRDYLHILIMARK